MSNLLDSQGNLIDEHSLLEMYTKSCVLKRVTHALSAGTQFPFNIPQIEGVVIMYDTSRYNFQVYYYNIFVGYVNQL